MNLIKGDIYVNNFFADLWVAINEKEVECINRDIIENFEDVLGLEKVGHIDMDLCYPFRGKETVR